MPECLQCMPRASRVGPTLCSRFGLALILVIVSLGHMGSQVEGSLAPYVKRICRRFPIHTTVLKQKGDNGFRIKLDGLPTLDTYRPGETYTGRTLPYFTLHLFLASLYTLAPLS
ncbi:hypothetical protein RRG08_032471 [Elysia crispata]|uniref:Uncharacterized protein n=1 Tax=Elysia crispata TaxID=231223 RepID=A0AAE1BBQ6_9GAST|nr:hypothetical protein RRG08_032471 [Elysia crispata]